MSATDLNASTATPGRGEAWRRLERWLTGSDSRPLAPPVYRARQWPTLAALLALACFVPKVFGGDPYHDGLLNNTLIDAILALGFYWCFCFAGQFTFAVVAVYATGAYVSVWAANHFGGFWSGFVLAMIVTGLLGGAIRLLFIRLSALYFAIATFGVSGLLLVLYQNWVSFTGGFQGVSKIAMPSFFGLQINTAHRQYYLLLGVLGLFLLGTIAFLRSPAMRDLTLARTNAPVAATAGLKPQQLMLAGFVAGSALQGAAGSLYAHTSTFFSLESFDPTISLTVLLMVLLGGMDSIYGPVIGAAVIVYLPEILRSWQKYSDVMYSALVLIIVIAFPRGIAGVRQLGEGAVRRARSH